MKKRQNEILANMLLSRDYVRSIISLKSICNLDDMVCILQQVIHYKKYEYLFVKQMFPQTYTDIHLKYNIPFIFGDEEDLENNNISELTFLTALLILNRESINRFIQLRNEFEIAYMSGNVNAGENILSSLEREMGYSYWIVESKMMLFSNNKGKNTSYSYYNYLKEKCSDDKIIIYLQIMRDKVAEDIGERYFISKLETYYRELDEKCDSLNFCNYYKEYIEFMCCYKEKMTPQLVRNLLAMSSHLGVIDRFILFEKIIVRLAASVAVDENIFAKNQILHLVKKIKQNIPYTIWNNIITLLDVNNFLEIQKEKLIVHNALRLYCNGMYDECTHECRKQLEIYSNNISLINLLAKCTDIFNEKKQYEKMAALLNCLYRKEGTSFEFAKQIREYDVFERVYSNFTFGITLLVIIEHEIDFNIKYEKSLYLSSLLMYGFTPSKLVFFLPDVKKVEFVSNYKEFCNPLYFGDWQISTYEEASDSMIDEFVLDQTSERLRAIKIASLDTLEKLYSNSCLSAKGKEQKEINTFLVKRLFETYTEEKRYFDAINVYLTAFFSSRYLVRTTNYKLLNRKLTHNVRKTLECNVEYCVYISITRFGVNDAISEYVVSSYKQIMKKYNESFPSRLKWPTEKREKKCFAYFLFNICCKDILGRVLYLEQDLNDERIAIVEKLIFYYEEIDDKDSIATLEDEHRKLIQEKEALNIANCIHKGKINLDWISLKDSTDDAIIVSFERINTFLQDNTGTYEELYHEFVEGFTEVKKDYVQEVNRLLSICIRHGTLEYYLISYFQRRGIICDCEKQEKTFELIENFYSNINTLIYNINHEYIYFTDKKRFNKYRSLYIDGNILKELFEAQKEFLQPIDLKNIYLDILNKKLERELAELGENVYDILKENIFGELVALNKNIENNMHDKVKKCLDQLEMGLQQVKEWFAIAQNQATPYKFETWLELLESEYIGLEVNKSKFDDFIINGNSVACLYNVFNNFLFNVVRHSGYSEIDSLLMLRLKIEQISNENKQKKISFRITNRVNKNKNQDEIINDVKDIKKLLSTKDKIDEYQNEEEKSGYKKIIRLLEKGFERCWDMDVGYESDTREFWVDLIIIFVD